MSERVDHFDFNHLSREPGRELGLITGGTSCGKTTLVGYLVDNFGDQITVVSQDAFYKSAKPGANFDQPEAIDSNLLVEVVIRLMAGEVVDIPVYDFASHTRTSRTVQLEPRPIIIVEGILLMNFPELVKLADFSVYVHAELDVMWRRRSKRDVDERGRVLTCDPATCKGKKCGDSVTCQWDNTVKPAHLKHVLPWKDRVDVKVLNDQKQVLTDPESITAVRFMSSYIQIRLGKLAEISSAGSNTSDISSDVSSDKSGDQ